MLSKKRGQRSRALIDVVHEHNGCELRSNERLFGAQCIHDALLFKLQQRRQVVEWTSLQQQPLLEHTFETSVIRPRENLARANEAMRDKKSPAGLDATSLRDLMCETSRVARRRWAANQLETLSTNDRRPQQPLSFE